MALGVCVIRRNEHRYGNPLSVSSAILELGERESEKELHFYYAREFAQIVCYCLLTTTSVSLTHWAQTSRISSTHMKWIYREAIAKQMFSIWISFKVKWVFAKSFSASLFFFAFLHSFSPCKDPLLANSLEISVYIWLSWPDTVHFMLIPHWFLWVEFSEYNLIRN